MSNQLEDFYIKLGQKIKILRKLQNLTQESLADKAGISLNYLGKIEIAMNKPRLQTIFKLAEVLGVDPFELLNFD